MRLSLLKAPLETGWKKKRERERNPTKKNALAEFCIGSRAGKKKASRSSVRSHEKVAGVADNSSAQLFNSLRQQRDLYSVGREIKKTERAKKIVRVNQEWLLDVSKKVFFLNTPAPPAAVFFFFSFLYLLFSFTIFAKSYRQEQCLARSGRPAPLQ